MYGGETLFDLVKPGSTGYLVEQKQMEHLFLQRGTSQLAVAAREGHQPASGEVMPECQAPFARQLERRQSCGEGVLKLATRRTWKVRKGNRSQMRPKSGLEPEP